MIYDIDKITYFKRNLLYVNNVNWVDLVFIIDWFSTDFSKLKIIDNFVLMVASKINLRIRADTVKLVLHSVSNEYAVYKIIFPYINNIC
jgi:hypothetical protein